MCINYVSKLHDKKLKKISFTFKISWKQIRNFES